MSWLDLAALSLVMWSATKGYLDGLHKSFVNLIGVLIALFLAVFLQKYMVVYLNQEWQMETVMVAIMDGNQLPVAASGETVSTETLASSFVKRMSLIALFSLAGGLITFLLRIKRYREKFKTATEYYRIGGLLLGAVQGTVLSVICFLALDTLSYTMLAFMHQDIANSYLQIISQNIMKLLIVL